MNVRSSSIVFALSCVTLGGIVYSQSSSVNAAGMSNYPFSAITASYERLANVEIQGMDRKVTKKFEGATLETILEFLSSSKLNFVADLDHYKNAEISLSFDDVRLDEALDSIADIFDAHWERNGDVFMLKPSGKQDEPDSIFETPTKWFGRTPDVDVDVDKDDEMFEWEIQDPSGVIDKGDAIDRIEIRSQDGKTKAFRFDKKTGKMIPFDLKELHKIAPNFKFKHGETPFVFAMPPGGFKFHGEGQAYKIDPKTGKQVPLTKEERAKLEKEWEAWGEKYGKEWEKWGETYGKEWEKWGKEFEKSWADGKGGTYVMPKMPMHPMPDMKMPDMKGYYFQHDGKPMTEAQKKAFEDSMRQMEKELKGMKLGEGHMKMLDEKAMKELHEHLQKSKVLDEKAMKELHEHLLKSKVHDEKAMKELQQHMKMLKGKEFMKLDPKALKELEGLKGFSFDGKEFKMLDPKALQELHGVKGYKLDPKAMEELHKMKGMKLSPEAMKELKMIPKMKLDEKAMKELESVKGMKIAPKEGMLLPGTPMVLTSERINKLLDSLTDKQKAAHKERGHLKWSELTPAQREMLGVKSDGNFSVSFTIGDRSITIKND